MKIAVVTPIPTPYRDPFWNVLAAQPEVDLQVYYCAAGKADSPWGGGWQRNYHTEILPGRNWLAWWGSSASFFDNPAIVSRLRSDDFDAVLIGGYNHPTMWRAMRSCVRSGTPFYLMCESHLRKTRSLALTLVKDHFVRWVVRHMAGGFPTGTLAEQYLLYHGAKLKTLTHLPNAPDVERIRAEADALRTNRGALRRRLYFSERPTLLFVGRLIPKKGVHILIDALAGLRPKAQPDLVIVGDGPERNRLRAMAKQLGVEASVRFTGFVAPSDLSQWYVAADAFALPSAETWGVVVAEALAAGTPVIVSDEVGCHPDVVVGPPTGRVLPRDDVSAWRQAMGEVSGADAQAHNVAAAWQSVFERLRYRYVVRKVMGHLETCNGLAGHSSLEPAR